MVFLSPVKSSVLLETVVYFEFCISCLMSVFKQLCLYSTLRKDVCQKVVKSLE